MLEAKGAAVTTVTNPEEAIQYYRPLSLFHLIICDGITGTETSGIEFLTEVRKWAPDTKLVLMALESANKFDTTGTPIDAVLSKPITDRSIDKIVDILK